MLCYLWSVNDIKPRLHLSLSCCFCSHKKVVDMAAWAMLGKDYKKLPAKDFQQPVIHEFVRTHGVFVAQQLVKAEVSSMHFPCIPFRKLGSPYIDRGPQYGCIGPGLRMTPVPRGRYRLGAFQNPNPSN
jgi:hypothetical protein